jgi:hypothetical protein
MVKQICFAHLFIKTIEKEMSNLRVYPGCDGSHNISDDLLSGTKDIEIE